MKKMPVILSKSWLEQHFNRSLWWIREHVLTEAVLKSLKITESEFKKWRDIPPEPGNRIKNYLKKNKLD
jgi:hypothetical protein